MKSGYFVGHHKHIYTGLLLIVVVIALRLPGLLSRAIWYDEVITLLETAGNAIPVWPQQIEPASELQNQFVGRPSFAQISQALARTDIHPPVYYWLLSLWRRTVGFSLEAARLFSLLCVTGSVLLLYALLVLGDHPAPFFPALLFATASGSVYMGHEARAYALATLFLLASAVFAYLAATTPHPQPRQAAFSLCFALCGGLAFQTNYLTLFPIGAITLWFIFNTWHKARWQAVIFPLLMALISLAWFETLRHQLGARPTQNVGFLGFAAEWQKFLAQNRFIFWSTFHPLEVWLYVGLLASLSLGLWWYRHTLNKKLFVLLVGMALAPSLGVVLLDAIFDKNLVQARYWLFALPGLSVLLSYGLVHHFAARWLLLGVAFLQLGAVNWNSEGTLGWPGSVSRSWAETIGEAVDPPTLVLIGAGFGRGFPGQFVYELDSSIDTLVLDDPADSSTVERALSQYNTVWILFPRETSTRPIESQTEEILTTQGFEIETRLETTSRGTAVRYNRALP